MTCPTCARRADNRATECARCGTDFALLADLDRHHDSLVERGRAALDRRNPGAARAAFRQALDLRAESAPALKGLALAALIERDFPTALAHYAALQPASPNPAP